MKGEVENFKSKHLLCRQVKVPRQKPTNLLQPLSVREWKWENILMDFIIDLSKMAEAHTLIWVIVDKLTKSTHFISARSIYITKKWA